MRLVGRPVILGLVTLAVLPAYAQASYWRLPAQTLGSPVQFDSYSEIDSSLAVANNGTAVAAWGQFSGVSSATLRAAVRSSSSSLFSEGVEVPGSNGVTGALLTAISPSGNPALAWTQTSDETDTLKVATISEGVFTTSTLATGSADSLNIGVVAVEDSGALTVAYSSGGTLKVAKRSAGSQTFDPPETITSSLYYDAYDLTLAPSGEALLLWAERDYMNARVRISSRPSGAGSFSPAATVSGLGGVYSPGIKIGPDGSAYAIWADGGVVRYSKRTAGSSSWSADTAITPQDDYLSSLQLVFRPNGDVTLYYAGSHGVYPSRMNAVFSATRRSGQNSFDAPVELMYSADMWSLLSIGVGSSGNLAAVIQSRSGYLWYYAKPSDSPYLVPVQRISDSFSAGWDSDTALPDGSGRITAAWFDPNLNAIRAAAMNGSAYTPTLITGLDAEEGSGWGTITSDPYGINCSDIIGADTPEGPTDCTQPYPPGTLVTLTPNPSPGDHFVKWKGACSGSGACVIPMNSDAQVTAVFNSSDQPVGGNPNGGSPDGGSSSGGNSPGSGSAPQTPPPGGDESPPSTPVIPFSVSAAKLSRGSLMTSVSVPAAGVVTQVGSFKKKSSKKAVVGCKSSAAASKPSTLEMSCALSKATKKERRKRGIPLRLCTSFKPAGGKVVSSCQKAVLKKGK